MAVTIHSLTNTYELSAEGDILSYDMLCEKIVWVGASSGATLRIEDLNGSLLWAWTANTDNYSREFSINRRALGFYALTMSSGTLFVTGTLRATSS